MPQILWPPPCHQHWSLAMTSSAVALWVSSAGFVCSLEASHSPFWNRVNRLRIHNSVSACKREIITGYDPEAASVISCQAEYPLGIELSPLTPSLHLKEKMSDYGLSHRYKGDVVICTAACPSPTVSLSWWSKKSRMGSKEKMKKQWKRILLQSHEDTGV